MKRLIRKIKFILKEIVIKYFFCYILAVITMLSTSFFDMGENWKSWCISFSASIFALPVIFVIYTLYVSALERKTQKKIFQKISKSVINVFTRYLFFTQYFYNPIEEKISIDPDILEESLRYSKEKIFQLVSDNIFAGILIFSEFDKFDDSIDDIINQEVVCKYANQEDISVLIDFINAYKEFKEIFHYISEDHFILCGKYKDIDIYEDNHIKNSDGKQFYNVSRILDDRRSTFYAAIYPIYEKNVLISKFKLSGTKSQEVANAIAKTYECINKWLNLHPASLISVENGLVMDGRLYLGCDLIFNAYMKQNVSITGKFS